MLHSDPPGTRVGEGKKREVGKESGKENTVLRLTYDPPGVDSTGQHRM